MRNTTRRLLTIPLLSFFTLGLLAQTAQRQAVQLYLTAEGDGHILNWLAHDDATSYKVYSKTIQTTDWGDPVAELPGDATGLPIQLAEGEVMEFAVFKNEYPVLTYEVEVEAGEFLSLEVTNELGFGLCCNFGQGFFRLEGCGEELAYGADIGTHSYTTFEVCDNGSPTEMLTLTVRPDRLGDNTSWVLRNPNTGTVYVTSDLPLEPTMSKPAYGYLMAGNQAPAVNDKGGILLLIEETVSLPISPETDRLRTDLIQDGWTVYTEYVSSSQPLTEVKAVIQNVWQEYPDLNTLFIIGHVPVPYSGDIYPDGLPETHRGAWPADVYYGDMDGAWTDETVNSTTATDSRNHNVPGDGKFDQSFLPSTVELAVGRVDFFDMPAFGTSEIQLLKDYFQKNHFFRSGLYNTIPRRALIDDQTGTAWGAPAADAWRNYAPIFGPESIETGDYFETLNNGGYYLAFAAGNGSFNGIDEIGTTADFAAGAPQSLFVTMWGQELGDWDTPDNFLRASLASGITLASAWTGNPYWAMSYTGLGLPIGLTMATAQNRSQSGTLEGHYGPMMTHLALMGDPSLRLLPGLRSPNAYATAGFIDVRLNWERSGAANIIGYNIYRADEIQGTYELLNDAPVTDTTYIDYPELSGEYHYLVKTVILETTASGSYVNLSPGAPTSVDIMVSNTDLLDESKVVVYPVPAKDFILVEMDNGFNLSDVTLLDMHGRGIDVEKVMDRAGLCRLVLPKSMVSGIYFVKIENAKGVTVEQVVVGD